MSTPSLLSALLHSNPDLTYDWHNIAATLSAQKGNAQPWRLFSDFTDLVDNGRGYDKTRVTTPPSQGHSVGCCPGRKNRLMAVFSFLIAANAGDLTANKGELISGRQNWLKEQGAR